MAIIKNSSKGRARTVFGNFFSASLSLYYLFKV